MDKSNLKSSQLDNPFSIISNDCWGREVYRHFQLPYSTPFIGLFIMAPCYIKMLKKIKHYLDSPIVFTTESKYPVLCRKRLTEQNSYPIGLLNHDVEIHFLHYKNKQEAHHKWTCRKQRINWENILVKFDDSKDEANESLRNDFLALPFPKICFTKHKNGGNREVVHFDNWVEDGAEMFDLSLSKFSLIEWINGK
jgi:uncharacterized protein (DUF1919 family)